MLKRITTRAELTTLAHELGVRPDWHEPDEQDVTVKVAGKQFDNAGFWPRDGVTGMAHYDEIEELHVTLYQNGQPVAAVNLATLFAWAAGLEKPTWSELTAEYERLTRSSTYGRNASS
ncbi:hypothetical protein ABZ208_37585 [Streptomyces sp. NPDC006208]|uniref:hypothetical protein n=1 Tax=Streptomyces sp. NPDC006208 TaxID=3156734 RepID=UPI0033A206BC